MEKQIISVEGNGLEHERADSVTRMRISDHSLRTGATPVGRRDGGKREREKCEKRLGGYKDTLSYLPSRV